MLSKISEDKLFVHFQNVSNFWGFAPDPTLCPWTQLGDIRPQAPNLPTPGKILQAPMCNATVFKHICNVYFCW